MKAVIESFKFGWSATSTEGKRTLVKYTLGLISVSSLDALALLVISKSFSNLDQISFRSSQLLISGIIVACSFTLKSLLGVLISYLAVKSIAKEESSVGKMNLEVISMRSWTERSTESQSEIQNAVDRGPYLLTQSVLMGVCSIVSEAVSAFVIVMSILLVQPLTAVTMIIYVSAVVYAQHYLLSKKSSFIGIKVLDLTNNLYDEINDFHGLSKVLTVMKSKSLIEKIGNTREELAINRALQIFISNLPRYFLELILILGVALVSVVAYIDAGTTGVVAAVTLFGAAGFRLLPVLNRIQSLILAMYGSVPTANLANLGSPLTNSLSAENLQLHETQNEVVKLVDVDFYYGDNSTPTLQKINLTLEKGKQYAFVGLSGSGKTTLADIVLGVLTPTRGTISRNLNDNEFGYVPQDTYIAKGTLLENVTLEWSSINPDLTLVENALKAAKASYLDIGVNPQDLLDSKNTISGGQRQRIGIARALIRSPKLLVLDEATSALDSITEKHIVEMLESLRNNITTVVIAHRIATIQNSDEIIFLEDGKIIGQGTFVDLFNNSRKFRELVEAGKLVDQE